MEWFFNGVQFLSGVVALGVGAAVLALLLDFVRSAKLREAMGFAQVHPALVLIGVTLYVFVALLLLAGVVILIAQVIAMPFGVLNEDTRSEFLFYILRLAGLTTVLGAVIALPFTIIRLRLTQRQTDTATEALLNEKINAATQGLYARRQVTVEDVKPPYDRWEDDIVERCAAIDRLEGLAKENRDEIPRVARLLSVYVRELSRREVPPAQMPDDLPMGDMREWAQALPDLRSDMEKAAQTLGRLTTVATEFGAPLHNGEVDLRGANLQRADLKNLNFEKALMYEARLQGAGLMDAKMQGANLVEAQMQGADISWARMQGADLRLAQMHRADFFGAEMDETTELSRDTLRGAQLTYIDCSNVPQILGLVADAFGDGSITLPRSVTPEHPDWPSHWPKEELDWDDSRIAYQSWLRANHPDLAD